MELFGGSTELNLGTLSPTFVSHNCSYTDRLAHIAYLVALTKRAPINLIVIKKVKIDETNDDALMDESWKDH